MAKITIINADVRQIDNLRLAVAFNIDRQKHYDYEDCGTFRGQLNCSLNAQGGKKIGDQWLGNFLVLQGRNDDHSSGTITIEKLDERRMADMRVFVDFTIAGAKHSDYEDVGAFLGDITLKLDARGGSEKGGVWTGDFLKATDQSHTTEIAV